MPRFYLDVSPQGKSIELTGGEAHHLIHVRRIQPGNKVELFDKKGNTYQTEVVQVTRKSVHLEIESHASPDLSYKTNYCLVQGLLKKKSWDLLLQKAMELNLPQLIPTVTDHVARGEYTAGSDDRWNKILISAAKQCERSQLMEILPCQSFDQVLESTGHFPLRLMAQCEPGIPSLHSLLASQEKPSQIMILVGPEGGFSEREVTLAKKSGVHLVSLGKNILRAETAALAVIANIEFYYNS